jgi:hypothetical protein
LRIVPLAFGLVLVSVAFNFLCKALSGGNYMHLRCGERNVELQKGDSKSEQADVP